VGGNVHSRTVAMSADFRRHLLHAIAGTATAALLYWLFYG
jgi:hypothetical protein